MKTCSICHKLKRDTSFYKRGIKKLRSQCKKCEYRNRKIWIKDRGGKELLAKFMRNRDRIYPWRHRSDNINHNAGIKFVTPDDVKNIFKKYEGKCYYCGKVLLEKSQRYFERENQTHIDHVIPGLHKIENLVLSCFRCNRRKQDNTIETLKNFIIKIKKHALGSSKIR